MTRIAVIGVGPRGLSAVERIISHTQLAGPPIELVLIEPNDLGAGVHTTDQPDYLLLNTIASQLTIFSDRVMTPTGPVTTGPSLYEWCLERRPPVRFDEFLPRRLLAEYLQWSAVDLLDRASDRLRIKHLRTYATDVRPADPYAQVALADGTELEVDLALVTTGHGRRKPPSSRDPWRIAEPYPLPERTQHVGKDATVVLLGAGLSAMDMIAALTVGRGGRHDGDRYVPSGDEPRIIVTNRSGRLPYARPATRAGRIPAPARHLTLDAIERLRATAPNGQLDFARDVEPLIRREIDSRMSHATAAEVDAARSALDTWPQHWSSYAEYSSAVLDSARSDLFEAGRGLGVSLVKDGLECLRDHRDALRAALDPPGLTAASHRYFMTEYAPLINRVVIGPQRERLHELSVLIQAGIVVLGPGPRPELTRRGDRWRLRSTALGEPLEFAADFVIDANLRWPDRTGGPEPIDSALREWIRPGPGGEPCLALDRNGHPLRRVSDVAQSRIAVFGPPAEGASYYNHYVPSPGAWSRILTDLDRVLEPVLAPLPANEDRPRMPAATTSSDYDSDQEQKMNVPQSSTEAMVG